MGALAPAGAERCKNISLVTKGPARQTAGPFSFALTSAILPS
jgi:hypothetical protein